MSNKPSPWEKASRKLAEDASVNAALPSVESQSESTLAQAATFSSEAATAAPDEASGFSPYGKASGNKDKAEVRKPSFDANESSKPSPYGKALANTSDASQSVYGQSRTTPAVDKKPYAKKTVEHQTHDKKAYDKKPYAKASSKFSPYDRASKSKSKSESAKPSLYGEKKAEGLHKNNPHNGRYDMAALARTLPVLDKYLMPNPNGEPTIDFSNPQAVLTLNKALLAHHYGVAQWQIPPGYLCPPIPGRADYVHHLNDLLGNGERPLKNEKPRVLDIGTGANLIYPIIGSKTFNWQFTASDIDGVAITNVHRLVADNPELASIKVVLQRNADYFFKGVIRPDDYFELTLCNPPFFKSQKEAEQQAKRKWRNLKGDNHSKRNFGGQQHELWCDGGELAFLNRMAEESVQYARQVGWFTALVSQHEHVLDFKRTLRQLGAQGVTVVPMAQGQKNSRFIAWYFD